MPPITIHLEEEIKSLRELDKIMEFVEFTFGADPQRLGEEMQYTIPVQDIYEIFRNDPAQGKKIEYHAALLWIMRKVQREAMKTLPYWYCRVCGTTYQAREEVPKEVSVCDFCDDDICSGCTMPQDDDPETVVFKNCHRPPS